jgi:hypothetical protein
MKVNILEEISFLIVFCLARKYAALKKVRHCRTGKQHSLDDDEEDIGMYKSLRWEL